MRKTKYFITKNKIIWVLIPICMLLAASLACDLPASSGDGENIPATETMQALATMVAGTLEPVDGEGESSEAEEPEADDDAAAEASVRAGPVSTADRRQAAGDPMLIQCLSA